MTALKMGSAAKKSVLRFFLGKYFPIWGGDFASPHFLNLGPAHE
jgi:hypothetical protein